MADYDSSFPLSRSAPVKSGVERPHYELALEPFLGVAKVQVRDADPDAWFTKTLGIAPPSSCREIQLDAVACAWLAPGEWLLTGAQEDVAPVAGRCSEIAGDNGLIVDLTHARVSFLLSGPGARDALAAHCPLDLSETNMPVGAAARSSFADTVLFVSRKADSDGSPSFRLIFDQTMGDYAVRMLGG